MKTDITVILDKSGSMSSRVTDTIGGFNSFIETQVKLEDDSVLSLLLFDTNQEVRYNQLPLKGNVSALQLTVENYRPDGATALIDAMVDVIDRTGVRLHKLAPQERPDKVVIVVISDGEENSSVRYKYEHLAQRIEHQKTKYGWEFQFIGTNQDAIANAGKLGIAMALSLNYVNTSAGYKGMYSTLGNSLLKSRKGLDATYTMSNRAAATGDVNAIKEVEQENEDLLTNTNKS